MTNRYHVIALLATLAGCDAGGLLTVDPNDGGGGAPHDAAGGSGGGCVIADAAPPDQIDATDGKGCADAGACHPRQDNDPVLCAGKCAVVDDGCGTGTIYCDMECPASTADAPATCGYASSDNPACDPCVPDAAVMCPPDKPNGYACKWHPIQAPCADMGKSGDMFLGCCGGVQ